ncbi:Fpg/Nei family DNA glycosylase [Saccharopolyspora gloriosae]|uniref:Fpg/Nei family DNA glycosylase n=1 Tax=Saccharopolyspora gloriosae TaxID=455344 RepID=UPI001FB5B07F|nr:DNA-formamidopyrimidine glycosylase family protein [Saccharopolyspora gloriosae]
MPELPDVEGFRRVAERATGRTVRGVEVRDAQVLRGVSEAGFREAMRETRLGTPWRHGKWLVLPTAEEFPQLLLHFGMTGRLLWCDPGDELHDHDRVLLRFQDGGLRYRDMRKLTGLHLARERADLDALLGDLGPDALAASAADYRHRIPRTRRGVKSALMDQAVLAGLGNLTADEVLWQSLIHPARSTRELSRDDLSRLSRRAHAVLRQSAKLAHVPDRPSWLTGHRDEPDPHCPRCGTGLARSTTAGRTTYHCPRCQPAG